MAKTDAAQIAADVRRAGSSFYWAMRLQPAHKRRGLFAVYAFCRVVDDIADGDANVADPVRALERWSLTIDALYDGQSSTPLERELVSAIDEFSLRKADMLAVIEGMMIDAAGPVLRPEWAQLTHYCDCVASAVGRLCIRVFGDTSDAARALADHQGQALQLTNIMRDIEEDAGRGRIYVPREVLQAHGCQAVSPQALPHHPAIPAIRADIGAKALERYEAAEQAAEACDPVAIRPAMMMMDAYRQKLDIWQANGFRPPRVTLFGKLTARAALMRKAVSLLFPARQA